MLYLTSFDEQTQVYSDCHNKLGLTYDNSGNIPRIFNTQISFLSPLHQEHTILLVIVYLAQVIIYFSYVFASVDPEG